MNRRSFMTSLCCVPFLSGAMVAQRPVKSKVAGSSPASGAKCGSCPIGKDDRFVWGVGSHDIMANNGWSPYCSPCPYVGGRVMWRNLKSNIYNV